MEEITAGSRCRCLQGDSVSVQCCAWWCCLCLPAPSAWDDSPGFSFLYSRFIRPQKALFGSWFSTPNWGLTINNLLWAWSSSFHCWVLRYFFFTWDKVSTIAREGRERTGRIRGGGKGVFCDPFAWDTCIWKFAKICNVFVIFFTRNIKLKYS